MVKKINFTMLIVTVTFFGLSIGVLTGTIQKYVHFTGIENEIGFALLSTFGALIFCFGVKK